LLFIGKPAVDKTSNDSFPFGKVCEWYFARGLSSLIATVHRSKRGARHHPVLGTGVAGRCRSSAQLNLDGVLPSSMRRVGSVGDDATGVNDHAVILLHGRLIGTDLFATDAA
jgi:hypothetical protein